MEGQRENCDPKSSFTIIKNTEAISSLAGEKSLSVSKAGDETPFLHSLDNSLLTLNPQSTKTEELMDSLRNENKLLKGRLKGFEALASLYKQSKLLNSQLQKQCEEQRILLEQCRPLSTENSTVNPLNGVFVTCNDLSTNAENRSERAEKNSGSFEIIEEVPVSNLNKTSSVVEILEPLLNESDENLKYQIEEFDRTEDDDDGGVEEISQNSGEGCCLIENGECSLKQNDNNCELFEIPELCAFQRHLTDSRASSESKSVLMELITFGMKFLNLERQISQDEENRDEDSPLGASRFYRRKLGSPVQILTKEESTQTRNFAPDAGLKAERKLPPQVELTPDQMSSSDIRRLMNEVQILQAQAITFKDDFEQERKDREKIRSRYDSLRKHLDRLTAEHVDLKQKNRLKDAQLEEVKKENIALKHQMNTAMKKLNAFQPSSSLFVHSSRTQLVAPTKLQQTPKWICDRCTYVNRHVRNTCDMCDFNRSYPKNKTR